VFLITAPLISGQARSENLQPLWPSQLGPDFWRAFGLAMVAVFWPYDGWVNIGPVAEEIRQPQRNVPLALLIGMLIVITVYVGANFGYHLMMPMEQVQRTQTVAADVSGAVLGRWGITIAALGVMVSTFGALNGNLLAGPRIYFAMAREGLFPAAIQRVHPRFHTPANAIAVQGLWSVAQILVVFAVVDQPRDAFNNLTDFVILGGTFFYGLTVAAVFVLRYRLPDLERPYRTWGYPITPILYLISVVAVVGSLAVNNVWQVVATGALLLTGLVVYCFFRRSEGPKGF
jgi:amino acid transporter